MGREYHYDAIPGFIADIASIARNGGRQIDWDLVPDSYRTSREIVKANGAAAAGATSITVDALPVKVLAGTLLNFGTYAPVTVTVNDADVNATETTMTVVALTGPIPSGTILQFSGAGAGFAKLTAAAILGATTLTVEALPEDIDNAATALFPGGTIQARVTAEAAAAATSLTVDELQFAVADNAEATVGGSGSKTVPAGTVMAELSTGLIVPRADRPGSETATCLLFASVAQEDKGIGYSGHGCIVGGVIYQNLLPDYANAAFATFKTELTTAGVGLFVWQTYEDDSAA